METSKDSKRSPIGIVTAALVGVAGLATASVSLMYIAGMFGLSMAFANQVIAAVSVGGLVLAIVMAAISGGIAGVVVATARWAIMKWGKTVAAA